MSILRGSARDLLGLEAVLAWAASAAAGEREPSAQAAWVYEQTFVPALFGPWAAWAVDAAAVQPGERVLDVACGTGVVAREVARRLGAAAVVGLDLDPGMLAVARAVAPAIDWRAGDVQALPFADGSFDVVLCQFGLMFFADPAAAIREMRRVARPGGRIQVAVWGPLEASPGYAALTHLLERELGTERSAGFRAPFRLGDPAALRRLFADGGAPDVSIRTRDGVAGFRSLRSWVETEVRGWLALSGAVGAEAEERLVAAGERELAGFANARGEVELAIRAHLVTPSP